MSEILSVGGSLRGTSFFVSPWAGLDEDAAALPKSVDMVIL